MFPIQMSRLLSLFERKPGEAKRPRRVRLLFKVWPSPLTDAPARVIGRISKRAERPGAIIPDCQLPIADC